MRYTYTIVKQTDNRYFIRLYEVRDTWKEGTPVGIGDYKVGAILQDEETDFIRYFNSEQEAKEYMSRHTVQEEMERVDRIGKMEMDRMGIEDEDVFLDTVVDGYIVSQKRSLEEWESFNG